MLDRPTKTKSQERRQGRREEGDLRPAAQEVGVTTVGGEAFPPEARDVPAQPQPEKPRHGDPFYL